MPNKCTNAMCAFTFDRRNRPETCPKCFAFLGKATGTAAKGKGPKPIPATNPKHVTGQALTLSSTTNTIGQNTRVVNNN